METRHQFVWLVLLATTATVLGCYQFLVAAMLVNAVGLRIALANPVDCK